MSKTIHFFQTHISFISVLQESNFLNKSLYFTTASKGRYNLFSSLSAVSFWSDFTEITDTHFASSA